MNKLVLKKSIMLKDACYAGASMIERIFSGRQTLTVTDKMLPALATAMWREFCPHGLARRLANHVCKSCSTGPHYWERRNVAYNAWTRLLDKDDSIDVLIMRGDRDAEACTRALRVMFAFFSEYAKD